MKLKMKRNHILFGYKYQKHLKLGRILDILKLIYEKLQLL